MYMCESGGCEYTSIVLTLRKGAAVGGESGERSFGCQLAPFVKRQLSYGCADAATSSRRV